MDRVLNALRYGATAYSTMRGTSCRMKIIPRVIRRVISIHPARKEPAAVSRQKHSLVNDSYHDMEIYCSGCAYWQHMSRQLGIATQYQTRTRQPEKALHPVQKPHATQAIQGETY